MHNSKIAGKMKAQIETFSGILSRGLPKTAQRFVREAIFGIQVRQSVRLTEIGRSLNEVISLKKTENRLCNQLQRDELEAHIRTNLLREAAVRIKEDTLLIIDPSDITKKYAKKMEYMAKVHDGSENNIGDGYWMIQVIGAELTEMKMTPLYSHLYSQDAPEFESENTEILKSVDAIIEHTGKKGIWVVDRGGDRRKIFGPLLHREQRFLIRLVGTRDLVYRGKKVNAKELSESTQMLYAERLVKEEEKKEKAYTIEFGFRKVRLPGHKNQLYLVVVRGFGEKPLMLLTNVEVTKSRKSLFKIVRSYIKRWQIEDTIRFAKQSYQLEDIRLLTYRRIQNMVVLVSGAMYFACVWLGDRIRLLILAHHALKAAKRLFGIPDFRYYAVADGIKEIFAGYRGIFEAFKCEMGTENQLCFFEH